MDNETVYLPGKIRDRIQDLMKSRKVTQAELAAKIGCSESALSRFISGKTDKLGDESIIRIARAFEVSTDFLLGEVDEPDRKNYDISELGLSVEAARNLYTQKVNPKIVSYLLENPQFADTAEHRLSDLALLIKHTATYKEQKPLYSEYKKSRDKEKYLRGREREIILFEVSARALKAAGIGDKLPDLAKLREEYSRLFEEKDPHTRSPGIWTTN